MKGYAIATPKLGSVGITVKIMLKRDNLIEMVSIRAEKQREDVVVENVEKVENAEKTQPENKNIVEHAETQINDKVETHDEDEDIDSE